MRSGYRSGATGSPTRATTQPVARPTARHGLNAANTSPNSRLSIGMRTQKWTKTTVGRMLAWTFCTPLNPA